MTRNELEKKAEEIFENCLAIIRKKEADYCENEDAFDNLKKTEVCGASVEQGISTRLLDKVSRAGALIKRMQSADGGPRVSDETLQDTLDDLINYTVLLKVYLEEKSPNRLDK